MRLPKLVGYDYFCIVKPGLLVILPTYKERENVANMIHAIFSLPEPFHLLVVDDNSPDGTAKIVEDLQSQFSDRLFLVKRSGKLGLGTAYIHGFRWGIERNYEYMFEIDCDFSHNPVDLVRLLSACREDGYDLAIGSRYVTGVNVVNWPMDRVLISYFASVYVRFITGMKLRDTTAGFKCYRTTALQKILTKPLRFIGYAFQIEMKFKAWKFGLKIKEVPIIFTDRSVGDSKMSKGIIREAVFGVIVLKILSWFQKWN